MLSSEYKAYDPLAAEFIRTVRHRHFFGKYYLDRYDALHRKKDSVDIRILLSSRSCGTDVPDQVALYGFRSSDPNLSVLSPWEFCQWYVPHRLRARYQQSKKENSTRCTRARNRDGTSLYGGRRSSGTLRKSFGSACCHTVLSKNNSPSLSRFARCNASSPI